MIVINKRVIMLLVGSLIMFNIVKGVGDNVGGWLGLVTPYVFFVAVFFPGYLMIKKSTESKEKTNK